MRIGLDAVDLVRRGFEELSLGELARDSPCNWQAVLQNVEAQVELSMTLIQVPALWPRPSRKRRRGMGVAARPVRMEGGRWQRVIERASYTL